MMLQKRSSRWAGAKALFVVPLAGLALGAFAETVYVLPQDKGTQENDAFQIFERTDSSSISVSVDKNRRQVVIRNAGGEIVTGSPLYLVDGETVADLEQVDKERIRSISVLKDVSLCAEYVGKYGDKAKNGVILVTLKKEGEPDNAVPADAKNLDSVVVVGYGCSVKNGPIEWNSDEWKAKEKEFAKMDEYFRSDEWKAVEKKLAKVDKYFQSDEWKEKTKTLTNVTSYFQSDEWKKAQKQLSRFGAGVSADKQVYYIDGRLSNEAEVKALGANDIVSININKDKQPDGSVVSTIAVATKGSGMHAVELGAAAGKIVMPVLACEGSSLVISTVGTTRTYSGKFRFTSLENLPQGATILLDGKPVSRQQLIGRKLRQARFYMGADAAERGNAAGFLHCSRK